MEQPQRFGQILLFREDEANSYRTVYRAGLARGRAIERIIRLEVFDRPDIEADRLLKLLEASTGLQDKLRDPHIALGAGVGQVDGTPYTAYDFQLGTTLSTFMSAAREQSFPVPFDQALFIAERIALALAAAYRQDHNARPILHSFLTPDSVLLSNEGEVKVSGFEIGYALREQLAGSLFCAPYLSPESRAGQAPADHDDVFSLGSILFELVTGEPLSSELLDLEHATVQATGEPVPENLRLLLEGSFAPPASRIPDVVAWQQTLGRAILDGEYNPTTFNLAFLIHTLLREPLERSAEHLAQERKFLLPQPDEGEPTQESTAVAPAAAPSVRTRPDTAFWLGFSISGVAACTILLILLTLGSASDPAPASALATPTNATMKPSATQDLGAAPASRSPSAEAPKDKPPAQPASLVLTEVVNGELGVPLAGEELSHADEREAEIDRLKAEYEQELDRLRKQIIDNQRGEPAAKKELPPTEALETSETSEPFTNRRAEGGIVSATQSESVADSRLPEAPAETQPEEQQEAPAEMSTPAIAGKLDPEVAEPTQLEVSEPAADVTAVKTAASSTPLTATPITQPEASAVEPVVSPAPVAAQTRAQLLRLAPPAYPVAARRLGLSATAHVKVLISPRGKVQQAEIVGPRLGSGFDAAALAAVRRSRWQPATRDGEPVESWQAVTIEFQP